MPGGVWVRPEHGEQIEDSLSFAAYAYPTRPTDPPIDHVNFTVGWHGYWQVAHVAYPPASGSYYSGEVDLRSLDLPLDTLEKLSVSFDVYDREGHVNFAPHGRRDVVMAQTNQNTDGSYNPDRKTDILLITVTTVEAQAVLTLFAKESGKPFQRRFIGDKTYFDLGTFSGARVMMVQSEMGSGGPGGSLLVVDEGIRVLSPLAVIMVGIAFGLDQKRQQMGDILVSEQLLGYELQKVALDGKVIPRGDRPRASTLLLDRFRGGILDWQGPAVTSGLILSGEKLVDNQDFRDQLRDLAPEAIGGEMEGTGLYAAAQRRKVDWILVKAICDWADGHKGHNKAKNQRLAAENAVRFVLHILKQAEFTQAPPHTSSSFATPNKGRAASLRGQGTLLRRYNEHASWVLAVAWEPNGTRIASAGADGTVRIWEAETGESLLTYHGHTRSLNKINFPTKLYTTAWSPEGLRVASAGSGASVHVWNAATGQTLALYEEHSALLPDVFAAAWSPDGQQIASACSGTGLDKTVHLWDAVTGQPLRHYSDHYSWLPNFSVLSLAWSSDDLLAAACGEKTIRVWNARTGSLVSRFHFRAGWASDIAWSPDNHYLAAAYSDHTVQIWDRATAAVVITYRGHTDSVRSVAWSPDGVLIASASDDRTVHIWEALTGKPIYTYRGHADWVTSVSWSPDGSSIASASNDRTVQVWHMEREV